jgi:hypothetical protein
MQLDRMWRGRYGHVDERLMIASADGGSRLTKQHLEHVQACDSCRVKVRIHEQLSRELAGPWGLVPGKVRRGRLLRVASPIRTLGAGLLSGLLLLVVAGVYLSSQSGNIGTASPVPAYPLTAVFPAAASVDLDKCVAPAQTYGSAQQDWAEDYIQSGWIYLNFTTQSELHVNALRSLLPSNCAVYVRIVPLSSAAGRSLQDKVANDQTALTGAGVDVTSVVFDPILDKVLIGVRTLTPTVRAAVLSRYPSDQVSIVQQDAPFPAGS